MLCVLIVEAKSVVVNVMLFLMCVMSPPHALCYLSLRTVVRLCTLGVLSPFMFTCSMMRFFSLLLLGLCGVSSPVVVLGLFVRLS